ncbi:MAG: hypothetical protein AB7O96_04590 [Pseudobdellovibrionaceae bacterium]
MYSVTLAIGVLLTFCTTTYAQNQTSKYAELARKIGEPLRFKITDGSVLRLEIQDKLLSREVQVPFKVIENECSKIAVPNCTYYISTRTIYFRWIWEANPEKPELVGTVYDFEDENDTKELIFVSGQQTSTGIDIGIPNDRLACPSFEFLPNGSKQAPEKSTISTWSGQFMFPNPDTSVNENQPLTGGTEISLVRSKNNSQELEVVEVESYFSSALPILFSIGGPSTLILDKGDQTCELIAETNANDLAAQISTKIPTEEFRNYIVGTDKYLSFGDKNSSLIDSINNLYQAAKKKIDEREQKTQEEIEKTKMQEEPIEPKTEVEEAAQ